MCFFPRDRRPVPPTLLSKKCNQIHRWRRNSWNNSKPSLTAKNPPTHNTTLNPVRSINTDSLSNSELIILGHRQQSSCCQDEEKRRNLLETRRNGKKTLDSSITKKNWRSQKETKDGWYQKRKAKILQDKYLLYHQCTKLATATHSRKQKRSQFGQLRRTDAPRKTSAHAKAQANAKGPRHHHQP